MCRSPAPRQSTLPTIHSGHWVSAWPFRVHLVHLAEATQLPVPSLGRWLGLLPGTMRTLASCRPRRGRIHSSEAQALLGWNSSSLALWLDSPGDRDHTRALTRALVERAGRETLARGLRLSIPDLDSLLSTGIPSTRRTELLAGCLADGLAIPCPASMPRAARSAADSAA